MLRRDLAVDMASASFRLRSVQEERNAPGLGSGVGTKAAQLVGQPGGPVQGP
jgi:hypothetical protein